MFCTSVVVVWRNGCTVYIFIWTVAELVPGEIFEIGHGFER